MIDVHDCESLYRVPILLAEQNLVTILKDRLNLPVTLPFDAKNSLSVWYELTER